MIKGVRMKAAWVGLVSLWLVGAVAQGQASEPARKGKFKIDRTQPVRMERLFVVRKGGEEQAKILTSSLNISDEKARAEQKLLFIRNLVRFADGSKVAAYLLGDFQRDDSYLVQELVVDVTRGEWVLMTTKGKSPGKPGFGAVKEVLLEGKQRQLVGFETRRLRIAPEYEQILDKKRTLPEKIGETFRTGEPELVELIQRLRRLVPLRSQLVDLHALTDGFTDYLHLPEVAACQECTVEEVRHALANDEPQPAPPMEPDFEEEFGKWATWRELPRLKGN